MAILSVQERLPGIRIVDVNTDYQRLWGGSREDWLGAAPIVVEQEAANQQIVAQLGDEINANANGGFEGISGREVSRRHDGSRRHIEWRITAMGPRYNSATTLVLTQRDVTEQMEKEAQLKRLATTDMLTGLVNRPQFDAVLKSEVNRQHRYARPLSLIMLDLDYFKQLNDDHGHAAGDQVLMEFSRLLCHGMRKEDVVCRWGGVEFLIMMPGLSMVNAHQRIREWRRQNSPMELTVGDRHLIVRFSAGLATAPEHGCTPDDLINATDEALYLAKKRGRDQMQLSGQLDD